MVGFAAALGWKWAAAIAAAVLGFLYLFSADNWEGIVVALIAGVPTVLIAVGQRKQATRDKRIDREAKDEQARSEREREETRWRVEREEQQRAAAEREQDRRFRVFEVMIDQLQEETARLSGELESARATIRRLEENERDHYRKIVELSRGSSTLVGQLESNGLEPLWRPAAL